MRRYFLILLFSNLSMDAQQNYKILPLNELNEIETVKQSKIVDNYILDYNSAFVIIFNDGTSILRPAVLGGNEGFYFSDRASMDKMIESKKYPIKDGNSFLEIEKDRIKNISMEIPYFLEKLSELLEFKVQLDSSERYQREFSKIVSEKMKKVKNKSELYYLIGLYIGELIRDMTHAEWRLVPQFTLNVYYEPELISEKGRCDFLSTVFSRLEMAKYIGFNSLEVLEELSNL